MLVSVLLFAVGLVLLIKGGDWFVDGAVGIAKRFNLPDIVVGATVVSIGTTLPEVMVSTTGALAGSGAMAYGNAIGSIICNTALIAAISITCNPGPVNVKSMKTPAIFFFCSAALYCVAAYALGTFPQWMGFVMLAIFVVYMLMTVRNGLKNPDTAADEDGEEEASGMPWSGLIIVGLVAGAVALGGMLFEEIPVWYSAVVAGVMIAYLLLGAKITIGKGGEAERKMWMELILLVAGAGIIAVGADLLVEHGQIIAIGLGVPETVVALLFVALGTSLPELVTTITSLKKGRASLGVGNVIGANIFNLVLVSGVAVSLAPFDVPAENTLLDTGLNLSLVFDIPVMLGVMSLMIFPALLGKKLNRWQGITLLCIYVAFCVCQFVL
ncbi:MAG: calcium/sodium antiporter [Oscillospiraceae bacterium]|nr:calcium/sodium antiporter [Oscillospiraceae bacterium]